MKILIVGAGVVGFHLARELAAEFHDITVVDRNPDVIQRVQSQLDVMAIHGDGTDLTALKKANISTADMLVAVSSSDETNLFICFLAFKLGVPKKIARIRKKEWFQSGLISESEFAIDKIINPSQLIVNYVEKIVKTPGLVDVADFADPGLSLMGFRVLGDMPILGKKISELKTSFFLDNFLIAAIYRKHQMIIPGGDDIIEEDDICYTLSNQDMVPFILPIFNKNLEPVQSIVVSGGKETGLLIAQNLENHGYNLTLVEPDKTTAEEAASILTKTRVVQGDPMESAVLNSLQIEKVDFFIAAGSEAKSNLLGSLLAKKCGAKKVIIITDETEYLPVMDTIGLDVVINPRLIIAGEILQHIHHGRIHSVIKLKTGGIEMVELETSIKSKAVGKPISKLNFPQGSLIGAVMEDGNLFFPDGSTVLKPGQEIILISQSETMRKAENFFL